jgi:hypothetical protein
MARPLDAALPPGGAGTRLEIRRFFHGQEQEVACAAPGCEEFYTIFHGNRRDPRRLPQAHRQVTVMLIIP